MRSAVRARVGQDEVGTHTHTYIILQQDLLARGEPQFHQALVRYQPFQTTAAGVGVARTSSWNSLGGLVNCPLRVCSLKFALPSLVTPRDRRVGGASSNVSVSSFYVPLLDHGKDLESQRSFTTTPPESPSNSYLMGGGPPFQKVRLKHQ